MSALPSPPEPANVSVPTYSELHHKSLLDCVVWFTSALLKALFRGDPVNRYQTVADAQANEDRGRDK